MGYDSHYELKTPGKSQTLAFSSQSRRGARRQSANLTPVPCSSTSKRSPLAATNLVCISGIQHIDLIRQYRGAGIDLLINGDRNDGETRELFASDVMPHLA